MLVSLRAQVANLARRIRMDVGSLRARMTQLIAKAQVVVLAPVHAARTAVRSVRAILLEWRRFLGEPGYRPYRNQALAAGAVGALTGPGLALPLLLILGMSPALVTLVLTATLAGPAMQVLMPGALRRSGGRFRWLTTILLGAGETVGLWVAPILLGVIFLGWSPDLALIAVSASIFVTGFASGTGFSNLGVWFHIVLPESERRFVAPRTAGVSVGMAALILLPIALGLDAVVSFAHSELPTLPSVGILPFALFYAAGGLAGLLELRAVRAFPTPGRVLPAKISRADRHDSPELSHFLRIAGLAAAGSGLGPYLSIYAMTILHASPGFAVSLSAMSLAASIAASTVVAAILAHRSSSRTLRLAYLTLGSGYALALGANPLIADALVILACANLLISVGGAVARLAVNERLFRLIRDARDADPLSASARFIGLTSAGAAGGQTITALVLALAPPVYLVYGALFALSGLSRFWTAGAMEVSPSWDSAVNERYGRRVEYINSHHS